MSNVTDINTESNTDRTGSEINTTVGDMSNDSSADIVALLQDRLTATLDLQLTLKHVHWNVVGMNFISVHEMLDPQVDAVRLQSDELAERIATLGGEPLGTTGSIVGSRTWDDYTINRAPTVQHLVALDDVYTGVIVDHRKAVPTLGDLDPVSEDLIVGHLRDLELFQWFIRAHLEDATGDVVHRRTFEKS